MPWSQRRSAAHQQLAPLSKAARLQWAPPAESRGSVQSLPCGHGALQMLMIQLPWARAAALPAGTERQRDSCHPHLSTSVSSLLQRQLLQRSAGRCREEIGGHMNASQADSRGKHGEAQRPALQQRRLMLATGSLTPCPRGSSTRRPAPSLSCAWVRPRPPRNHGLSPAHGGHIDLGRAPDRASIHQFEHTIERLRASRGATIIAAASSESVDAIPWALAGPASDGETLPDLPPGHRGPNADGGPPAGLRSSNNTASALRRFAMPVGLSGCLSSAGAGRCRTTSNCLVYRAE